MSNPNEPLKVDPTELRLTADQLDGQATGFRTAHEAAHSRAGGVALGSSQAAARRPCWDRPYALGQESVPAAVLA